MMHEGTKTKWEGRWDQLKGKARQAWGELTDDDLDVKEGDWEVFVGRIEERTGETSEAIRESSTIPIPIETRPMLLKR